MECIKTIQEETYLSNKEIIVVDNNSKDNSKSLIIDAFPFVKWIQMDYNSGFARANNEGIRQSSSPVVLLLNGDTLIENKAIDKCYQEFVQDNYVACGLQLLNPDRTPQISGNYLMKGGLNYLLPLPYLGQLFKSIALLSNVKKPNVPEAKDKIDVDWVNGAFIMVKRSAIEKAGLMDEDFFLYAEEAEWCGRLRRIGKICIYGDYNVIHLQGETANQEFQSTGKGYQNLFDKKGLQIMVSNLVRIRKQFGVGWFLFILSIFIIDIPVFLIGYMLSKLLLSKRYSFKNVKGFVRNILFVVRLVPTIISNKPHFYKV